MTKVLGKGLGALIKNYNSNIESEEFNPELPIKKIVPNKNQPRKIFDEKQLSSLIESVKEKGIIQPISVRKINDDTFEIIAGERRYRAAKTIKLHSIPAYILKINDSFEMMELALIENIQRSNLNAMEEAEGYLLLKNKYNFSQIEIAKKISKSRSEIANKLRILNLPETIRNGLLNNKIYYAHARSLLSIGKQKTMIIIYNKIVKNKLSIRQTESLIKNLKNKTSLQKKTCSFLREEKLLNKKLKTKVAIEFNNKTGKIKINFRNKKELQEIIEKIK